MNSFFKSFKFAFQGIALSLKQRNMKIHIAAAILVILAGFYFKINQTEWCIIFLSFGLVIGAEILNTAIEHFVDLVEPNQNPKAGAVKDLAAGAVLVCAITVAIVGVFIFGKYVLALL